MLKRVLFCLVSQVSFVSLCTGDTESIQDPPWGEEVVVTASRYDQPRSTAAASIDLIDTEQLNHQQSRTLPEALKLTTGIMIQKTSNGQGSPYLRGFTGYGTLMLVDGIRLNNATFRSGPNQYWSTIDLYSIDHLEIFKGPASSLYGSDAIGGTVQAFTLMPDYVKNGDKTYSGQIITRASSAERSLSTRLQSTYGSERFALLVGVTGKHFGDVHAAKIGRQRKTGYDELNYDIKLRIKMRGERELVFAHFKTDQNDVWRTHRTPYSDAGWEGTSVGNKEYIHTFDNDRQLTYVSYRDHESTLMADSINATLYYQRQEEVLSKLKMKPGARLSHDTTDVKTVGVNLDLTKDSPWGMLAYGLSYSIDFVDSSMDDPTSAQHGIQGSSPDDSTYQILAAYLQDQIWLSESIDLTLGTRLTHTRAKVGRYYNKELDTPPHTPGKGADSFDADWTSWCQSARLGYHFLEDKALVYTSLAQGYRTPNLSDLARNGEFASSGKEVPSPNLDPERYLTGEIGLRYTENHFSWHAAYFYTDIKDTIVRVSNTEAKVNGGSGYVHGFETELAWQLHKQWLLRGGYTIMSGRQDYTKNGQAIHEPLRTMPMTAWISLRWQSRDERFWAEIIQTCVSKEDRLTASDRKDTQRIPPDGTPGYALTDLRIGYQHSEALSLTLALENCFDQDYRSHGSGSNEPGRNIVLTAAYKW